MLTVAGFHVPVMPLLDVADRIGDVVPLHIGAMGVKAGVTLGLTVTFKVAVVAHCPADGVNV